MMLDPQKRDKFSFLTYLPEDQKVQVNAMYLRGLRSVYEFKAGAASSTANNAHCEAGAGAAAWVSPHSHARSRKRSTLFSRMEEELVVPSPSAPGFARQLLSDIVYVERRVLYEKIDSTLLNYGVQGNPDTHLHFLCTRPCRPKPSNASVCSVA